MRRKAALITVIAIGAVLFVFASDSHGRHRSATSTVAAATPTTSEKPAAADPATAEVTPEDSLGNSDGTDAENPDQQQPGGSLDEKLASLKELRDSGVISDQDYQAKVSALQGGSSANVALPENGAMRTVEIGDPQLQMPAATLQIPADWRFGGAVVRTGGCHGNGAQVVYSMQSPDGLFGIQVFPGFVWRNTGQPPQPRNLSPRIIAMNPPPRNPCEALDIETPEAFLEHVILPNLRPFARVTNIGPYTESGQEAIRQRLQFLEQGSEEQAARFRQAGFPAGNHPVQHTLSGAIAYVHYNLNGHEVEEIVQTAVHCASGWVPGNYVATPSVNVNCNSWPLVIMRAPRGTLMQNIQRLVAIKQTYRVDRTWDYVMGELIRQMGQQMLAASNAAFQAMTQNSEMQAQIRTAQHNAFMAQQNNSFVNSQAQNAYQQHVMDESAHNTVLYALDERAFVDRRTGTEYDVTNQVDHLYLGSDGTLVGSRGPLDITSTVPGINFSQVPMK